VRILIFFFFLVEFAKQQVQPTLYSYSVLKLATRDFHQDNELGKGGFGVVYKVSSLIVCPFIIDNKTFICFKLHLMMSNETLFDFSN
jgi:hypothetical protein